MFETFPPRDVQQSLSTVSRKLTEQSELATKSGEGSLEQLPAFFIGLFRKRQFDIAVAGSTQISGGPISETPEAFTGFHGPLEWHRVEAGEDRTRDRVFNPCLHFSAFSHEVL